MRVEEESQETARIGVVSTIRKAECPVMNKVIKPVDLQAMLININQKHRF